jgi:hypothetical protein
MNQPIITNDTMRADHQTWLAAHAEWRHDIERWKGEHEAAAARLAEMQNVVRLHGEALEEHARAFRQAEDAIVAHEREIAEQAAGASKSPQDVVANRHRDQEGAFSRQQDAHARIQKHHEAVMAQLQALENAAAAAM